MRFKNIGLTVLAAASLYATYELTPLRERFQSASCGQTCEQQLLNATEIEMRSVPLRWGNYHNLYVNKRMVGHVEERTLNIGQRFDIFAGDKNIGSTQEQMMSWGDHAKVYDNAGKELGTLDEKLLKITPRRMIEVRGNGRSLMATERLLTIYVASDITDNTGKPYGAVEKRYLWDQYHISLPGKSPVDNRMLISLVAIEEKLDQERKERKDQEEEKKAQRK